MTATLVQRILGSLATVLFVAGCEPGPGSAGLIATLERSLSAGGFPPDRSAFQNLAPLDQGIHAKTVVAALERSDEELPISWRGDGASGSVTIAGSYTYDGTLFCRTLRDTLQVGGQSGTANDVACMGDNGWVWLRDSDTPPEVLAPVSGFPTYRIRSGGTLAAVARRTKHTLEVLQRLNPDMVGQRLRRGERVVLPPA